MLKLLHCTEMMTNPPTDAPATRSAAAERMRRYRQRQRDGLRCLTIELRETEIDALARNGFLKTDTRNDLSVRSKLLCTNFSNANWVKRDA
jgi:hypothetical protein